METLAALTGSAVLVISFYASSMSEAMIPQIHHVIATLQASDRWLDCIRRFHVVCISCVERKNAVSTNHVAMYTVVI
jgi:uncharacterized protein (DUF2237 family)